MGPPHYTARSVSTLSPDATLIQRYTIGVLPIYEHMLLLLLPFQLIIRVSS